MQRHGDCGAHHLQKHADAAICVQLLEGADEVGKRSPQNSDALTLEEILIKKRHIVFGSLYQRLDYTYRYWQWSTVAAHDMRNPDRTSHG
jgi:hypothetical protein